MLVLEFIFRALTHIFRAKSIQPPSKNGLYAYACSTYLWMWFWKESAEHFLLRCIRFQDAKNKLIHTVNEIFTCQRVKDVYSCQRIYCWHQCLSVLEEINTKNCSLSIVLTATDQKPQKSLKRWYYPPSHCLNVNMMLSNMTFLMIFAVFDRSPLTLWINCSF